MNNKIKIIFFTLMGYIFSYNNSAAEGGILGADDSDLRNGNIHLDDIPEMIKNAIDFFINIAGTIAIIFIIIGAYQILLGSLESDKSKGKETIIMALTGFAIASLAWFIVKLIIDNLS